MLCCDLLSLLFVCFLLADGFPLNTATPFLGLRVVAALPEPSLLLLPLLLAGDAFPCFAVSVFAVFVGSSLLLLTTPLSGDEDPCSAIAVSGHCRTPHRYCCR